MTTDIDESADIESIDGIGPKTAEALADAGVETVGDLRSIDRSELYDIEGIGAATASQLFSFVDGDTSDGDDETREGAESDEEESETDSETEGDESESDSETDADAESSSDESAPDSEADADAETEGDDEDVADDTATDDTTDDGASTGSVGLLDIRNQTVELAPDLINRDLDGIIEVTQRGDQWVSVVEMIERKSVPDTQDILGRYELEFDEAGTLTGYRRVNRYRRNESNPDEF
ncbi:Helix-hairpin-helix domain-containing protein [Halogranum amylolyticum]|uniref:Helix-hairpin-helix domain-containing protein n=1 Tax=Halogranum amylolyticum TaxID=660520 RepID=A0A1H8P452_9EURY|nr:gas vesicle protein GvpO [Halogranum amylolyticum]SEO36313.1 Helix-hairpin-helix domain-containing protein [Halogranum amylolyticum]